MCGIAGTIGLPFDGEVLNRIAHRGPDDCGLAAYRGGAHSVTLGHRRLAILDLSPAGHQPMETPHGRQSITFNGEIYNHQGLRTEMRAVPFAGHSDTETILHYLARNGIRGVAEFNGIFALAFLDLDREKLYLARDPFGIKPLYYWHEGAAFAFASEMRAIRPLVRATLDTANLAALLRLRYSPSPDTLFTGIRKVRPGHVLEVDLARPELRVAEYPYVGPAPARASVSSLDEAVREYGAEVEAAVKGQLMADVEVGVFLSGGVDSAVVAALARGHAPYRMKAFTVGYEEEDSADEIEEARRTAAAAGLDHYHVRIGREQFLDTLRSIVGVVEEPLATTSVVPMWHLSALAARHVKVVLSGQGADESLGGYRRYQLELFRGFLRPPLAGALRGACRRLPVRNGALLRALDAAGEADDVARFNRAYAVFSRDQIRRLIGCDDTHSEERIRYTFDLLACGRQRHSVERMMSLDLRMNLADDLLLYTDKITMAHSLECRVPLLDLRLVRYIESLPYRYRVAPFRGKVIHKRFARGLLPPEIAARPKKGFLSPTRKWFGAEVRELLLDPDSRLCSHFDRGVMKGILEEHEKGFNRDREIFLLLCLYYWFAEYA